MIKEKIVGTIKGLPGGSWCIKNYMHLKRGIRFSLMGSTEKVFTYYYTSNNWGNQESLSGNGSSEKYTENIRIEIPKLLSKLNIDSVLDAPCGDYYWFKLIDRNPNFRYIGGDIVKPMILKNKELFESDDTTFTVLDIIRDPLPPAGLWLCRDCLFHFSYDNIFTTLHNYLQSDIPYILTSTHTECKKNRNIVTGDFRLINLELPPFNLGKPTLSIKDWIDGTPVRYLNLWSKAQISAAMSKNAHYLKRYSIANGASSS